MSIPAPSRPLCSPPSSLLLQLSSLPSSATSAQRALLTFACQRADACLAAMVLSDKMMHGALTSWEPSGFGSWAQEFSDAGADAPRILVELLRRHQDARDKGQQQLPLHDEESQRILDHLFATFALPDVERATDLLPGIVALIGQFLGADCQPSEYGSVHAQPNGNPR